MENYLSKVNKGALVILNLQFELVFTTEEHIKMFEYNYNHKDYVNIAIAKIINFLTVAT